MAQQPLQQQFDTKLYNITLPTKYQPQLASSLEFKLRDNLQDIDYTSENALDAVFNDIPLPTEDFYVALNETLNEASDYLRSGECISFPTETVYGLGANAKDTTAVSKIYQAKGRPSDNPLIVHIATLQQFIDLTPTPISPLAIALIHHFWPGPLSIILPHKNTVSEKVTAGLSTLAIRMPNHPIALGLIKLANCPIAAPSSNTSGKPSPTMADHVMYDLKGKIPGIVNGQVVVRDTADDKTQNIVDLDCTFGLESTVIDISHVPPDYDFSQIFATNKHAAADPNVPKQPLIYILRPGAITKQMLENIVGEGYVEYDPTLLINVESFDDYPTTEATTSTDLDSAVSKPIGTETNNYVQYDTKHHDLQPKSPGMKYTHYAPQAPVYIAKNIDVLTTNLLTSINQYSTKQQQQQQDQQGKEGAGKIGLLCTTEMLEDIKQKFIENPSIATTRINQDITMRDYIDQLFEQYVIIKTCGSKDNMMTVATKLYRCLREFDQIEQVNIIYAELLSHNNLGAAIMDRLLKAAGGKLLR